MHPDFRLAGSLPSLDMPHHLRQHEWLQYREGVTIDEATLQKIGKHKKGCNVPSGQTCVDTGLRSRVFLPVEIAPGTRVTVKFKHAEAPLDTLNDELLAKPVAPSAPREEAGYYWGYSTRSASSLSAVLTECPFDGGYDMTVGTSERGVALSDLTSGESAIPEFRHMMIIFGGVAGLEVAVKADVELGNLGAKSPEALFDRWVNLCPGQGSRTIRTEEAVWIGLMGLRETVTKRGKK